MAKRIKKNMLSLNEEKIFDGSFTDKKPVCQKSEANVLKKNDNWSQIKKRTLNRKRPDNVENWSMRDMFFYVCDQHAEKIDPDFKSMAFVSGTEIMHDLHVLLKRRIDGNVPLSVMKDYIDWFIANKSKSLVQKYRVFKVSYLIFEPNIKEFIDILPAITRSRNKVQPTDALIDNNDVSALLEMSAIDAVYILNPENLVKRYGLIIPVIYLIHSKDLTEQASVDFVLKTVCQMVEKNVNIVDLILKNTEKFSPYAKCCKFNQLKYLVNELTKKTGLDFNKLRVRFSGSIEEPLFMRREVL